MLFLPCQQPVCSIFSSLLILLSSSLIPSLFFQPPKMGQKQNKKKLNEKNRCIRQKEDFCLFSYLK